MIRSLRLLAFLSLALTAPDASAQGLGQPPTRVRKFTDLATVELTVDRPTAKWGETVFVRLSVDLKNEGWTYPTQPRAGQAARNAIVLPNTPGLIFIDGVTDPAGMKEKADESRDQYYPESVTWTFKAVVSPKARAGEVRIGFGTNTTIQVCRENCYYLKGDKIAPATLTVIEGASDKVVPADLAAALAVLAGPQGAPAAPVATGTRGSGEAPTTKGSGESGRKAALSTEQYRSELTAIQEQINSVGTASTGGTKQESLGAFLLTAAAWGLISLITPCVFPMIPITVSIFLKQAHGSLGERLKLAGVYCGTIIIVLGISAFALLKFMAWLSANPVTNILLGTLFLVLALSLFGMYELTLPNFMLRRLQSKQQKGGVAGMVFGALAFTVISFTCVAPFLGGFAGISAANAGSGALISVPTTREVLGGLVFATAFAAPFFVLALLPGLLRALPKSGGWLDSVKVVMGFLEVAAAVKFFRTAEIRLLPTPAYFTYDLVLAGWVAIAFGCGLYLLNVYRLPHDEDKPSIGVMRLLFATLFLGFGLYVFPALFKGADGKPQRPAGAVYAWVEAFLLPEPESWGTDLKGAIDRAKKSGRPVFLDFTGKTCTNCRYNEQNVFTQANIRELLERFERVQLYTDEVPAAAYSSDPGLSAREQEAVANRDFQINVFKDSALPLYAVLVPTDGKVQIVGVYDEGKINSPEKFARFLQDALANKKN